MKKQKAVSNGYCVDDKAVELLQMIARVATRELMRVGAGWMVDCEEYQGQILEMALRNGYGVEDAPLLRRAAKYVLVDYMRRAYGDARTASYRGARIYVSVEGLMESTGLEGPHDTEREVIVAEARRMLSMAVGSCSEQEREVVRRYFVEGWREREIGQALGMSESRVCQVKRQALAKMSNYFRKKGVAIDGDSIESGGCADSDTRVSDCEFVGVLG